MAETKPIGRKARKYMMELVGEYWRYFEVGDMSLLWSVVGFSMEEDGHTGHQKHDEICWPYYRLAIKMVSDRMEVLY